MNLARAFNRNHTIIAKASGTRRALPYTKPKIVKATTANEKKLESDLSKNIINFLIDHQKVWSFLKRLKIKIYFNYIDYFSVFIKISLIKNDILTIE